ncbi:MAG: Kelch repeat-containing protein [Solirubrobacteraceae bacterium]
MRPPSLHVIAHSALPSARSGGAATAIGHSVVFAGGLSDAGVSTATVFRYSPGGGALASTPLPSPIHDAAAAGLGDRVLVFGGGVSEGSDHIMQLLPGQPRLIGTLPQALSDLVAAQIGDTDYVAGGWNGAATNRDIYAVGRDARARPVARLPTGVRYPAAGALAGKLVIAGGELTSGSPTARVWSFDPATGRVAALPNLPAPIDHATGAVLAGRFYVIGGLRKGNVSPAVYSIAPGESRWHRAGELPAPVADASAVTLGGSIVVLGGRNASGRRSAITLLGLR